MIAPEKDPMIERAERAILRMRRQSEQESEKAPVVTPVDAPTRAWPEPLGDAARHGLAGEFLRVIEPTTESDPAALLVMLLCGYGSVIGRGAYFVPDSDHHFTNEFVAVVGETSKARKNTALAHVFRLLVGADEEWINKRLQRGGLSSGEGLIWAVRDEAGKDPGEPDKRLLVSESEFASTLRVMGRDGNSLSPTLRSAWDSGHLNLMNKNSPARSSNAHVSVIGLVTVDELRHYLTRTESTNGFANRFLWVAAKRSRFLPHRVEPGADSYGRLAARFRSAVDFAKGLGKTEIFRDQEAESLWQRGYAALSDGAPGLYGAATSRGEAHVVRLSLIYALLDEKRTIERPHLEAALEVWRYCDDSALFIFGDGTGKRIADKIQSAITAAGDEGLTQTEINRDVCNRNIEAAELADALQLLEEKRRIYKTEESTGGRPAVRWRVVKTGGRP